MIAKAHLSIRVMIPGQPVAQGRPRFARVGKGVRTFDPAKSKDWKAKAGIYMQQALAKYPEWASVGRQALCVTIRAYWPSIKPDRKRRPRAASWRAKRPDGDNVAKAVQDAGEGVFWEDDGQIAMLIVEKRHAAQGDMPRVEVEAEVLP